MIGVKQTPTGELRARIIVALRAGSPYKTIAKEMGLPSTWPLRVIAKEEKIFRGAKGAIVTEEELQRQIAKRAAAKAPKAPEPVVSQPDSLRQRVLESLREHGAFTDARALLDSVRRYGDETINMDRLGTLLYQMRKENLVRADERKNPNGAGGDHGSTRLVNVRLADRMLKADPQVEEEILTVLRANGKSHDVGTLVRALPNTTRGEVILALRDLKAGGKVDYVARRVGLLDEIEFIRILDKPVAGSGPVTREIVRPAPVSTPAPVPVVRTDTSLGRWPRLLELRNKEVDAHHKAMAASKLIDAAALLEGVDHEAFELLMARAEAANKATLTPTEEEYLAFAREGTATRCMGLTLAGDPCHGYRGHDGRHYPKQA